VDWSKLCVQTFYYGTITVILVSLVGLYTFTSLYYECEQSASEVAVAKFPEEWKVIQTYFIDFYNNGKALCGIVILIFTLMLLTSIYALFKYYQFKSDPMSILHRRIGNTTIFYKPLKNKKIAFFLKELSTPDLKLYSTNNPRIISVGLANIIIINERVLENLPLNEVKSIIAHEVGHFKFHYLQKLHLLITKRFQWYFLSHVLGFLSVTIIAFLTWQNGDRLYYNLSLLLNNLNETNIQTALDQFRFILYAFNIAVIVLFVMFVSSLFDSAFIKYAGDYMLWQQEYLADAYSALYTKPSDLIAALKSIRELYLLYLLKGSVQDDFSFYRPKIAASKLKSIFSLEHPSVKERIDFIETIKQLLDGSVSFRLNKKLRKPHDISTAVFCPSLYFGDLPRFVRKEISREKLESIYGFLYSSSRLNICDLSEKFNIPLFHALIIVLMLSISKILVLEH